MEHNKKARNIEQERSQDRLTLQNIEKNGALMKQSEKAEESRKKEQAARVWIEQANQKYRKAELEALFQ